MVRVKVPEKDLIRLVLCHLQRSNLIHSMHILEKESGVHLVEYGRDLAFFRSLVLEGLYNEAKWFLQPCVKVEESTKDDGGGVTSLNDIVNKVYYYLNKQIFLEKCFNQVQNKGQNPGEGNAREEVSEVVKALKMVESSGLASK